MPSPASAPPRRGVRSFGGEAALTLADFSYGSRARMQARMPPRQKSLIKRTELLRRLVRSDPWRQWRQSVELRFQIPAAASPSRCRAQTLWPRRAGKATSAGSAKAPEHCRVARLRHWWGGERASRATARCHLVRSAERATMKAYVIATQMELPTRAEFGKPTPGNMVIMSRGANAESN